MPRQHWKRALATTLAGFVTVGTCAPSFLYGQSSESLLSVPAGLRSWTANDSGPTQYLRFAHFTIPFNVDQTGRAPSEVHLWVSPDSGRSWLKYGTTTPDKRGFEFHAAAEGEYLFAVQTRDDRGDADLAGAAPMRIVIDTSKPQLQLQADISSSGRLIIDCQIGDAFLAEESVRLAYSVDGNSQWEEIRNLRLEKAGQGWTGRCELEMPRAREIEFKLTASDLAQNLNESQYRFSAPRTASAGSSLQLASQRGEQREAKPLIVRAPDMGIYGNPPPNAPGRNPSTSPRPGMMTSSGGVPWNPDVGASGTQSKSVEARSDIASRGNADNGLNLTQRTNGGWNSGSGPSSIGRTVSSGPEGISGLEVLPTPRESHSAEVANSGEESGAVEDARSSLAVEDAYHSRSRSFSLDYSVDSLRGMSVSEIELWGTEDGGRTWQKWGRDPDRESPFDVQVESDGLFGFRMVIVGANGLVSNRPQDGDAADMVIHVDTEMPRAKITRALYGEGNEAGMLIIDYHCDDNHLHDRPVTLSYSQKPSGPWVTIASALPNTGTYSWKADPSLPQQVYVRIQVVDKAGNKVEHSLDLPVNLRGLSPRGRIQGVRPIDPSTNGDDRSPGSTK